MALFYLPQSSAFGQHVIPSDGAKLYFYESGTTTPKTVYSDPAESVAHTQPVVANSSGRFAAIFLSGTYKVVLKDKNDVQIWEEDGLGVSGSAFRLLGDFDSSTNGGNYPASGTTGDLYRVTEEFVLAAASGSHQLYIGDFIVANKAGATGINADWDIIKGRIWLIDEDDFASDTDILAPSQQSVKAYLDNYAPMAPDWIAGRTYAIGDYVKASDFKIYRALVSQSGNDPSGGADPTNWLPFGDLVNLLTSTDTTRGLTAAQGKVLKDVQDILVSDVTALKVPATETTQGPSYIRKRIILSVGSVDPANDIDTTAGNFTFSGGDGSANIGAFTKQLDATWAQGTNQGGRAAGVSYSVFTWYHYFALSNSDGSVVDLGFDTSVTAANLLADAAVIAAGLTKYRRVGSIVTDITPAIIAFFQIGKYFHFADTFSVWNIAPTLSTVGALLTIAAPLGIETIVQLVVAAGQNVSQAQIIITSPDQNNIVPSATVFTLFIESVNVKNVVCVEIKTNTSSQIRYRANASAGWTTFRGVLNRWEDITLEG
jgi:hypothetical protein